MPKSPFKAIDDLSNSEDEKITEPLPKKSFNDFVFSSEVKIIKKKSQSDTEETPSKQSDSSGSEGKNKNEKKTTNFEGTYKDKKKTYRSDSEDDYRGKKKKTRSDSEDDYREKKKKARSDSEDDCREKKKKDKSDSEDDYRGKKKKTRSDSEDGYREKKKKARSDSEDDYRDKKKKDRSDSEDDYRGKKKSGKTKFEEKSKYKRRDESSDSEEFDRRKKKNYNSDSEQKRKSIRRNRRYHSSSSEEDLSEEKKEVMDAVWLVLKSPKGKTPSKKRRKDPLKYISKNSSDDNSSSSASDDEKDTPHLTPCRYGANCRDQNKKEHTSRYSHPTSNPLAAPVPKTVVNSEVCQYLLKGWCNSWAHFKGGDAKAHPPHLIRCKFLDAKNRDGDYTGCTKPRCKYQHPNPTNLDYQKCWASQPTAEQRKKENCFYLCTVPNMQPQQCVNFKNSGNCSNPQCTLQHTFCGSTVIGSLKNILAIVPAQKYVLKPVEKARLMWIQDLWKLRQQKTPGNNIQIVKVEEVWSDFLIHHYKKRENELMQKQNTPPSKLFCFHGTDEASIPKILLEGFREDKQINNAYGKGTYFANDPRVSVGYCKGGKKMILAQILVPNTNDQSDFIWASGPNFFIVPNPKGILPLCVIQFQ